MAWREDGTPVRPFARGDGKAPGLLIQLNVPGKKNQRSAAEVVLTAFGRPRPSRNARIVFLNGDRTDNRDANLGWDASPRTAPQAIPAAWKACDLLPGYEAHPTGHVRRIGAKSPLSGFVRNGIAYVTVTLPDGRTRRAVRLDNVILSTFVGPQPTLYAEAVHLNGDTALCRADNLRWDVDIDDGR
jgi:hypothetical protein